MVMAMRTLTPGRGPGRAARPNDSSKVRATTPMSVWGECVQPK